MTDTEAVVPLMEPTTVVPAEPAAPVPERPRRSRLKIALVVTLAVLLGVVVAASAYGLSARSAASDDRAEAQSLRRRESALERRETSADHRREQVEDAVQTVETRFEELGRALDATNVAEQAYTDATNRAAVLYNSGDEAGSVAVFQTDGQVTLDELGRQVAATDTALESVRVAVLHLQEVVR